jgi:hypothetical protein
MSEPRPLSTYVRRRYPLASALLDAHDATEEGDRGATIKAIYVDHLDRYRQAESWPGVPTTRPHWHPDVDIPSIFE